LESGETKPEKMTRRELLRLAAVSAVGLGAVLGARGLVGAAFPAPASTATASSLTSTSTTSTAPSSQSQKQIKVKVAYFQMPLVVNTSEEYFYLQSPAQYSDLLPRVLQAHPNLSPMLPTMMVMIDGMLAQPDSPLSDGDEVDFIPAMAGG